MKKILITLILLGLVVLPGIFYAAAAAAVDVEPITKIINNAGTALNTIGLALIVLMIVYAGILFITASGEPEKISKAKQAIVWAVIGGVVIIAANAIKTVIENITK